MKKKNIILLGALMLSSLVYSQVGINNEDPKATLDVTAKTTDGTKPEGIIAPRLTGEEIKGKDAQYLAAQTGTIVYATSASSDAGVTDKKTININGAGYYYFDGNVWVTLENNDWHITGNSNIDDDNHFLGTTTDQDLVFKRNSLQAGWVGDIDAQNISFGLEALRKGTVVISPISTSPVTGKFNGAIGYRALYNLTFGTRNQAMGNFALGNIAGGDFNVGIGNGAGLGIGPENNHNTAIGNQAMTSVGSGYAQDGNTAIGDGALRWSAGSNNVAIGYLAAGGTGGTEAHIAGSNNIVIGARQTVVDRAASNQLNIGGAIFGTGLTAVTNFGTGNIGTPAGNIGIGTAAPTEKLDVNGAVKISTATAYASSTISDGATTPVPDGGAGTIVFQNAHFFGWNGSAWKQLDNN